MHGDADGLPRGDPVVDEEVGVLEITEDAEVDGKGGPQPPFALGAVFRPLHADADEEVHRGGEGDKPKEVPVPPAVEGVRRGEEQEVLRLEVPLGHEPIQPEHDRQEDQEFRAVEEHDIIYRRKGTILFSNTN